MDTTGLPPRRAALYLLEQITSAGRLLPECLAAGALDRLPPDGRARAQRLTVETLRHLSRADAMLTRFVSKAPPTTVQNILRLATVELCQGGAAHGVVHDWVEVTARGKHTGRLKGLVNAVLRKVAGASGEWHSLPAPRMPDWLRDPLVMAWGEQAMQGIEAAHAAGAALDLTAKSDASQVAAQVGGAVLPTGSVRVTDAGQVSTLPGYDAGVWWVQDAAAAIPARVLAAQPGEKVLDLCAAPGGKTLQLATGGADVTAVDISESRLKRLRDNLKRTGLKAKVRASDAFDITGKFDAILLDAPCSATGTMRRHPDLPYAKDGSEFAGLIDLQAQMIDHALTLLSPGGRLVFCTCSLLPDEGEVQVEEALERHPNLRVDRDALALPGVEPAWIGDEGGLRLRPDYWPDRGGMDGFYAACLRMDGAV